MYSITMELGRSVVAYSRHVLHKDGNREECGGLPQTCKCGGLTMEIGRRVVANPRHVLHEEI